MRYLITLVFLVACTPLMATEEAPQPTSLRDQYREMYSDVEVIDGFRMVKLYHVDRLWKSVIDSIRAERVGRQEAVIKIAQLEKAVKQMEDKLATEKAASEGLQFAGDHIRVMGADMTKSGFITMVVIGGVGLLTLLILAVSYTRVNMLTVKDIKRQYDDLSREYETYKHQAVEKQIKLSRELQTERNRLQALKAS
jgi:hypothetical protein